MYLKLRVIEKLVSQHQGVLKVLIVCMLYWTAVYIGDGNGEDTVHERNRVEKKM